MKLNEVECIDDLALVLGVKASSLTYFAYFIPEIKKYSKFTINKKGGGLRIIFSPTKGLKDIQHVIYKALIPYYNPKNNVHGYVKGKGIISNANVHKNMRWIGRVDIQSYYPSINIRRIIGLFQSRPFYFPKKIAILLAHLCTHLNQLPQGAPTSPILSNLIVRRLDSKLAVLAKNCRCFYSRYADDIFISTNMKTYPKDILSYDTRDGTILLGEEIKQIFTNEDFKINISKLSLKNKSQRQMVTGVIVNQGLNVPREYIREIRAMLYLWKKYDLHKAENIWREKFDNRNRINLETPRFRWVLRGKLAHLAFVKGKTDAVYKNYAKRLSDLDKNFMPGSIVLESHMTDEVAIFTEGETDVIHLKTALKYLQKNGEYTDINFIFPENKKGSGDKDLEKYCNLMSKNRVNHLLICLFDRDVIDIVSKMKTADKDYKDHGNNVFSLVIPKPSFRNNEGICIECYYQDDDLLREDAKGRRIYLQQEFDIKGFHKKENHVMYRYPKKMPLIIDFNVMSTDKKENIALSKKDFAKNIERGDTLFDNVNFLEFKKIFDLVLEIRQSFLSQQKSLPCENLSIG